MLFIIVAIIIIYFINSEQSSQQEDKVKSFLDKLKKRKNPKEIFAESCIICLEDFKQNEEVKSQEDKKLFEKEETSILECGHKFHRKCIADWLKKEQSCPLCRMKFDIKGDDNKSSQEYNRQNNIFNDILTEILRIQSNRNMLNEREVYRIRSAYDYNYRNNLRSYSSSSSSSSHSKSFSSYNRGAGGATSSW